jgi:hypothetical protein
VGDVVFIQRSRVGRTIFTLREKELEVASHAFGQKYERTLPVRSISADYQVGAQRINRMIVGPVLVALACFSAAAWLLTHDMWPQMLGLYAGMLGVSFLLLGLRFIRRVEYFTFRDHWQRPLFSILREHEQSEECNSFVCQLLDRIERAESGQPEEARIRAAAPPMSAVRLPDDSGRERPPNHRWLVSIIGGAISTVFPPVSESFVASPAALAVVVMFSTIGLIWAGMSFAAKEPKRLWASLGIVLSIGPIFWYSF